MTELTATTAGPGSDKSKLHVGWIMPPFFHELPVDAKDPDELGERLGQTVTSVLPGGTGEQQVQMFLMYLYITAELQEAAAVYGGFCFMDMDGRPSTASVAVYQTPLENTTADDVLADALSTLRRAYPDDDVRISALPGGNGNGQAVVRIGDAPFTLDAEDSPTGEPVEVPRGQIQVYIPLPNDSDMLIFELSTPSMEDWDYYSELFATVLRSLDWATEEEAQMAAALSQPQPVPDVKPDPEVVQALYGYSSRVLDGLSVLGRMDEGNQVSAIICPDCWSKGMRSVCSARHQWQIDDVDEAVLGNALGRLNEQLPALGWTQLGYEPGVNLKAHGGGDPGHRIGVTVIQGWRRIVIEVIAPCNRTMRGPADSVFG